MSKKNEKILAELEEKQKLRDQIKQRRLNYQKTIKEKKLSKINQAAKIKVYKEMEDKKVTYLRNIFMASLLMAIIYPLKEDFIQAMKVAVFGYGFYNLGMFFSYLLNHEKDFLKERKEKVSSELNKQKENYEASLENR